MIKKFVCSLIIGILLTFPAVAHRPSCGSPWHCYFLLQKLITMSHDERVAFSQKINRMAEHGKAFYEIKLQADSLKKTRGYTSPEEYEIADMELNLYNEEQREQFGLTFEQDFECRPGSGRAYLDAAHGDVDSFNFGQLPFSCIEEIERAAQDDDYTPSPAAAAWYDSMTERVKKLEQIRLANLDPEISR